MRDPDLQQLYSQKLRTPEEAAKLIRSGDTVFLGVGSSTPLAMGEAIGKREGELENVRLITAFLREPQRIVSPDSRAFLNHTYFMGVQERVMNRAGRGDFTSIHLSEAEIYFRKIVPPDVAVLDVTPPDENGEMNLGAAGVCVGKYALENARTVICQINRQEPWVFGEGNTVSLRDVDAVVEKELPLSEYPALESTPETEKVAEQILEQIPDGATVQFGIGGVSNAVGLGLKSRNDLGGYTELMTDTMMELMKLGVVNNRYKTYFPGRTVAAFALGSGELYRYCDRNEALWFRPFPEVNNPVNIAKNDGLISINTALQIDLFGQVNAENRAGDQYSATGGQVDFVRGAQMSKGGKSFIALTARYGKGRTAGSRIVAQLPRGTAVTTPRSDVQYVVTEYGCVNLKELSMRDRSRALIELAAPEYRDELKEAAALLLPEY